MRTRTIDRLLSENPRLHFDELGKVDAVSNSGKAPRGVAGC